MNIAPPRRWHAAAKKQEGSLVFLFSFLGSTIQSIPRPLFITSKGQQPPPL